MAFHFFTEPLKLQNQTALQAFGAIDDDNYRLGNMFTANSSEIPKAFAITSGNVLVQEVNSTTVNIILKPDEQPNIDLPKIDYIIYKGIVKSSLVNGTIVADLNNNDLTKRIWNSNTNALNEGMPNTPNEPIASYSLGLGYSATATDDYKALDNDSLNLAFYHHKNKLTKVDSGFHIGDFHTSGFGILITLQKIGFEPTFKLARKLDLYFKHVEVRPLLLNEQFSEVAFLFDKPIIPSLIYSELPGVRFVFDSEMSLSIAQDIVRIGNQTDDISLIALHLQIPEEVVRVAKENYFVKDQFILNT